MYFFKWGGVVVLLVSLFVCLILFSLLEGCGPKQVNLCSLMGMFSGDFQSTLAANVDSLD